VVQEVAAEHIDYYLLELMTCLLQPALKLACKVLAELSNLLALLVPVLALVRYALMAVEEADLESQLPALLQAAAEVAGFQQALMAHQLRLAMEAALPSLLRQALGEAKARTRQILLAALATLNMEVARVAMSQNPAKLARAAVLFTGPEVAEGVVEAERPAPPAVRATLIRPAAEALKTPRVKMRQLLLFALAEQAEAEMLLLAAVLAALVEYQAEEAAEVVQQET
jgi:hypothetical protein